MNVPPAVLRSIEDRERWSAQRRKRVAGRCATFLVVAAVAFALAAALGCSAFQSVKAEPPGIRMTETLKETQYDKDGKPIRTTERTTEGEAKGQGIQATGQGAVEAAASTEKAPTLDMPGIGKGKGGTGEASAELAGPGGRNIFYALAFLLVAVGAACIAVPVIRDVKCGLVLIGCGVGVGFVGWMVEENPTMAYLGGALVILAVVFYLLRDGLFVRSTDKASATAKTTEEVLAVIAMAIGGLPAAIAEQVKDKIKEVAKHKSLFITVWSKINAKKAEILTAEAAKGGGP